MIDVEQYRKNKWDERFCAGLVGLLWTGDGLACGTFLGYLGDPGFEKYQVTIACPGCDECDGSETTLTFCLPCQERYREQGLLKDS